MSFSTNNGIIVCSSLVGVSILTSGIQKTDLCVTVVLTISYHITEIFLLDKNFSKSVYTAEIFSGIAFDITFYTGYN